MTGAPAPAIAQEKTAALKFLEGGEAILFVIRPSLWFVVLASAPFLVGATIVGAAALLVDRTSWLAMPPYVTAMLWMIAVMIRLFAGSIQWLGRLYVLTNRRVITIHGLRRFRVSQCPLGRLRGVDLSVGPAERTLGLGTLSFRPADGAERVGEWVNLSRPVAVREEIEQAMRRCGG